MKIGVSAFAWTKTFTARHLELFGSLRQHGLTSFEIGMFDPAQLPTAEIRRAAEANDVELSVCVIPPVGINPIHPDEAIRNQSRNHLAQCVEAAAAMGAHLVCGPMYAPNGYLPGRRRNQDEWNWAIDCFQSLGAMLDSHDMTLAIEPVNRSETFFLNSAAEAADLCRAIGYPRIGVTIDTFHANIEEKSISNAISGLGTTLKHMHLSENDRGLLGTGHVGFNQILEALNSAKYSGSLVIEGFGYSPSEPDSLGALWGDFSVSPQDIAYKGAAYLKSLL